MDVATGLLDAATGGVFGGLLRLAPEVLKILDRKFERAHELAMQEIAIRVEQLRGANREAELGHMNEGTQLQAVIEAVKSQAQLTGHKLVDIVNATVRPVVTYWFMVAYSAVKVAGVSLAIRGGQGADAAIAAAWTSADMGLLSGILTFWFLNRVFVKGR